MMNKFDATTCAKFSIRVQYLGSLIGEYTGDWPKAAVEDDTIAAPLERNFIGAKLPLRGNPIAATKFFVFTAVDMNARRAFS